MLQAIRRTWSRGALVVGLAGCADVDPNMIESDVVMQAVSQNDTVLNDLFDFAKQPCSGGEFPVCPRVHATFVRHAPNSHPQGDAANSSDLVWYVNAPLTLSTDERTLSGESKAWRNRHQYARPPFFDSPAVPEDAFVKEDNDVTFFIQVTDAGVASIQMKLKELPIGGLPPIAMNATYVDGRFVEASSVHVTSLSFTLQ